MVKWCRPWTNLKRWNRFSFSLSRGAPSAQSEQYSNREKPSHVMFKANFTILFISSKYKKSSNFLKLLQALLQSSRIMKNRLIYWRKNWRSSYLMKKNFEAILKSSKRRQSLPVNVLPDSFNLKNGMPAIDEHSQRERDPFLI